MSNTTSADLVHEEITGHSWLQRNWRPITMLVFVGMVVVDFIAPESSWFNLNDRTWLLLEIGIGGYIGARSAEKIVKMAIQK